jgi:DNA polymerase elongation subunit (family B)
MDPVLFGSNSEARIVAVHQQGESVMRVYARAAEGAVTATDVEFFPFFYLSRPDLLEGYRQKHWIKELAGTNYFRYLCAFPRWSEMWDAVRYVLDRYNAGAATRVDSYADLPVLHLRTDPVGQFLLQSGRTLFKEMTFGELHRLQLDIETYTARGHRFSNAARDEDRIIVIALSDNRGYRRAIAGPALGERDMLLELVRTVHEIDPDVIEGHNIFNFDLPYILKRCELHGVDFAIGRDRSVSRTYETRAAFADRSVDFTSVEIGGRHVVDTWLLLQAYDVAKRSLESYGLKSAAKHFGLARQDRIYIAPEKISWYYDNEPDLLARYAMDDVDETRLLSELLSPPYFYLAQMVPLNYGAVARAGSAAKIESLLLREYIRQKHSVPSPGPGLQTTGGYTDIFLTGIAEPVVDVDVESLYPSIMIADKIAPRTEGLGVFTELLTRLTALRLDAKRAMRAAADPQERAKLDAVQSSLKILINSFYGYLGYNRALFNDVEKADQVTTTGQRLLRQLIEAISSRHATVVQVDTDGIFFSPPPGTEGPEAEEAFVRLIARELPPGIHLAVNGRARAMLSYKKKNYALLGYDNRITMKGSSLTSRSLEKFGRNFIEQCIDALLNRNVAALHSLYVSLWSDIAEHRLSVHDFARTESLKDSVAAYTAAVESGERNRTASYEVALAAGLNWKPGDRIAYYITGKESGVKGFEHGRLAEEWDPQNPDENAAFYQKRLQELAKKFEVFFHPQDFRTIFSIDDLFPFSAAGIEILTVPVADAAPRARLTEDELSSGEPRIWLEEPGEEERPDTEP